MEEKILVKSSGNIIKRIKGLVYGLAIITLGLWLYYVGYDLYEDYIYKCRQDFSAKYEDYYFDDLDKVEDIRKLHDKVYDGRDKALKTWYKIDSKLLAWCIVFSIPTVPLVLLYFALSFAEITVTDKRVYGKAILGKRVDLPLDSISAIGITIFNTIAVATSAGRIQFTGIENRDEVHRELSNLLIERQEKIKEKVTEKVTIEKTSSNADELKKFKDLLDSGIITQEEFDAKKKQLLGL